MLHYSYFSSVFLQPEHFWPSLEVEYFGITLIMNKSRLYVLPALNSALLVETATVIWVGNVSVTLALCLGNFSADF